jgi:protein TonB
MQPMPPDMQDETLSDEPLESAAEDAGAWAEFDGAAGGAPARRPRRRWRVGVLPLMVSLAVHAVAVAGVVWWVSTLHILPKFARMMGSTDATDSVLMKNQQASPATPRLPSLADAVDPAGSLPRESDEPATPPSLADDPIRIEQRDENESPPIIGVGAPITTPKFRGKAPAQAARPATVAASNPKPGQPAAPRGVQAQPTAAVATPPRVPQGGRRGTDDGFDERGLPLPEYPPESVRRREEGLVTLDVEVLPDGSVGDVKLLGDAGYHRLGEAAIEAMHRARKFDPATLGGLPVTGHLILQFQFDLK